jgi:hypothetical protein
VFFSAEESILSKRAFKEDKPIAILTPTGSVPAKAHYNSFSVKNITILPESYS